MSKPSRPEPPRQASDSHGAGPAWGPSIGWLALAVALLAGGLAWWWASASAAPDPAPATSGSAALPSNPAALSAPVSLAGASAPVPGTQALAQTAAPQPDAATTPAPRIWRKRDVDGDQTPDLADYVNQGETPTMAEVIARLHQAGVQTGLGAFSPPGTRPPLIGLAVPEDYVLPAGYVRHYQATDDGQRIEPILMYSPHQPPLDANGQPVAVPADRVVPAELAPAGLPLRRIVVPAPVDPSRGGR